MVQKEIMNWHAKHEPTMVMWYGHVDFIEHGEQGGQLKSMAHTILTFYLLYNGTHGGASGCYYAVSHHSRMVSELVRVVHRIMSAKGQDGTCLYYLVV